MCCLTNYKLIILVVFFVGFLSIKPEYVSASRSIDRGEGGGRRLLVKLTDVTLNIAPSPAMSFDPNQSGKRAVRGGSDPIHNRW